MDKIIDYKIVEAVPAQLAAQVKGNIFAGWHPLGGVAHSQGDNGQVKWIQAMVRYEIKVSTKTS